MMLKTRSWFVLLAAFLTVATAGCGNGGNRRYELSGEVIYAGTPIPHGQISFDPTDSEMGGGFAMIENGRFDTREQGRGHWGGTHEVRIVGHGEWIDPDDHDQGRQLLFEPYDVTVDLPTRNSSMDFEVPANRGGG